MQDLTRLTTLWVTTKADRTANGVAPQFGGGNSGNSGSSSNGGGGGGCHAPTPK